MRIQLNLNRPLGITKDGELILVNYLFSCGDGLNGEAFHGATGATLMPLSQDYIDERNEVKNVIETYGYLWEEAVKDGNTTDSQEEYMQAMIDAEVLCGSGLFFGHDDSYIYDVPDVVKKTHFDGYESFECVGGGRMFPVKQDMLIILDQDLWDAVNAIEAQDLPLDMIQSLVGGKLTVDGVECVK